MPAAASTGSGTRSTTTASRSTSLIKTTGAMLTAADRPATGRGACRAGSCRQAREPAPRRRCRPRGSKRCSLPPEPPAVRRAAADLAAPSKPSATMRRRRNGPPTPPSPPATTAPSNAIKPYPAQNSPAPAHSITSLRQRASWGRSAFDGSKPSPATTCGNGSASCVNVAMRAVSFVQACITLSRRGPACCGGHGYMTDGVRRVGAVCWAIGPTVNTAARGLGDLVAHCRRVRG